MALAVGEAAACSGKEVLTAVAQLWDVSDGQFARGICDIAVPLAPFPGVMGVALDELGSHNTAPPRQNGGNMDIKQLTAGATVFLPVWIDGALFSVGDAHGAQGDGEVCITAVEMNARITLGFALLTGHPLAEPQLRTSALVSGVRQGPHYGTTGHGPDLHECARQAIRHMIDHLVRERGLSREEAYILCSVAVDLKVIEIVDAPDWIVSAFLPEGVGTGDRVIDYAEIKRFRPIQTPIHRCAYATTRRSRMH